MTWFLYLLLTIGVTLGQHEKQHQTRLEDIENENLISERRSSSDSNYAKSNSVSFTTSKPTLPQLQFGFTPMKEYFTLPTESSNPSINGLQYYQNRGQIPFNNHQTQAAQQYQTQFYQQPEQQNYQLQTQQQQNYQYQTQPLPNFNLQESGTAEYLQPQAQALQPPQVIGYHSETGKADQYSQVVPQYGALPQEYQSVAPTAFQSDKPSQVIHQQFSKYSTFPQQQQDIRQNQQSFQFNTLPQAKLTSQNVLPSKAVQYQQEVLQYQDNVGLLQKTGSSNQVQVQDISSLQYLQPQLQGLGGVSYYGNGQVRTDFLNNIQDLFNHNLFYQPQTSASTSINSYVQPQGPLQYFSFIPANVIENSPKGGFVRPEGNGLHAKGVSQNSGFLEKTKVYHDLPIIRQATGSKKYTNLAQPQKNWQKLVNSAKNNVRFEIPQNISARRPTSLLDSYVPSAVQIQYFKDVQLKQQQQQQEQQLHQLEGEELSRELNENLQPPPQNDQHYKSASHKRRVK